VAEVPAVNQGPGEGVAAESAGGRAAWRGAWQLPLLGGGVVLLGSGIVAAFLAKPRSI
jgi:hypothetical protein